MSPGVLLAVLLVLITAQVTRLLVPGRGNYLAALAAAAVGLLTAELVALSGHGGPTVGAVHPVADLAAMAAAEVLLVILIPRRAAAGR